MSEVERPESPTGELSDERFRSDDSGFADSPQPETPQVPFEPESRQKLGGRGCVWMVGVGCGLVLLAALALVAVLAFNGDRILAWSLGQFETQILADVPESVSETEQERLREAFTAARERIRAGEVDPQALQSFQSLMMEMAFKPPGERDADDYRRLQEALDRLAEDQAPEGAGSGDGSDGSDGVRQISNPDITAVTNTRVVPKDLDDVSTAVTVVTVVTAVTP